jgi:restriction system protein
MDQALLETLREAATRIPELVPDRQYWFIRTNGGKFYQDFWESRSVGIGHNLVTLEIIKRALAHKKDPLSHLATAVLEKYPATDALGRRLGLIERFMLEMREGDVVIMPNAGGDRYAFGEVTADAPFEVGGDTFDDDVIYRKRRSVKWIRRRKWAELDPKLYYALRAPQALTRLNDYADYLDRTMYAIYRKGGETHVRLDVKTAGGIDGDDYFDMGHSLLSLCREFKRDVGMPEKGNKIEVRSNVQSPGIFEFITQDPALAGFLACVVTVAVFGGHAKSEKFGISIGTDGLLKGISNFLMEGKKRQLLEDLRGNLGAMNAGVAADAVLRLTGTSPSSPSAPPTVSPPATPPQALPPADPAT